MQTPTLTAILEALAHPAQQSPLLARSFHPLPHSASNYRIKHQALYFPMSDGSGEWQLIVPLSGEFEVTEEQLRKRVEQCNSSQLFAYSRYIPKALTLFDIQGRPYTLPALLQQAPLAIDDFIRRNCSSKHRANLRRALESLALGAEELLAEGVLHGSLSRKRVCFDLNNRLKITDFPLSGGTINDTAQLAEAAILLFVAGCQVGAYRAIATQSSTPHEHTRRLRCILSAAQYYSVGSLVRLTEHIAQNAPSESIVEAIKAISAEPFRPMPLLESLLGGGEVAPHNIPCHHTDNTVVVDWSSCDEVLPAGEGMVRYRRGELWGYARENGERLSIERTLLYAEEFRSGIAVVKTARGYGLMNIEGRMVMNDVWDTLEWHSTEGIVTASDSAGKWHIYNPQGGQLSTAHADWMGSVAEGFVVARSGNKFGYFSTKGTKVTDFMYDEAFSFHNGVALVAKEGKRYHIDTSLRRIASDIEKVILEVRGQLHDLKSNRK